MITAVVFKRYMWRIINIDILKRHEFEMFKKIYSVVIGVLMMLLSILFGLFYGVVMESDIGGSIAEMVPGREILVLSYLILILTFAGCVGSFIRGASLIKSVYRSANRQIEAVTLDVITTVFVSIGFLIFVVGTRLSLGPLTTPFIALHLLFIALSILDAILIIIELRKEKGRDSIRNFRWKIIYAISIVLVPSIIIFMGILCKDLVDTNMRNIQLNATTEGNFESFCMYDLDGNEYTEDIFKDHNITMINIWGTFCHPCIAEMPELQEISEEYSRDDLQIIGLTGDLYFKGALDQVQVELAKEIVKKTGVTYPVLIPSNEIQTGVIEGQLQVYPTTIFFDRDGKVLSIVTGASSKEDWIEKIELLDGEK